MAKVTISLDSDLAIDVMLLSGTSSPQDAVELIVRDYLATRSRTAARTGDAADQHHLVDRPLRAEEG